MPHGFRGRSLRRIEDARFLTGVGRFIADAPLPEGCLHAVVLRSPHAHARLLSIDAAAARVRPGVAGIVTGADLLADGVGPMPCMVVMAAADPLVAPPRHALAVDLVRHVGEPVAFVLAESAEAARDAAERIEVEYETLPAVIDARAALAPGAPRLHEEAPGNQAFRFQKGDRAAVEAAIARAAHVVTLDLVNNRVHAAPIEPRGLIACHDPAEDRFHLLLSGQGVHGIRRQLAEAVFRIPPERIHLVAPDVGGGFGLKNALFPEHVAALWAARRFGRPVRWIAEASEEFIGAVHARDLHARVRLALDADGRFLALDAALTADMGAYLSAGGPGCSTNSVSAAMGGVYAIPAAFVETRGAFTNTVPLEAYRGAGKPESNYLIERAIDAAARQLGRDPAELRRRNMIGAAGFPYRTALGMTIDGGRFAANLDAVERRADRAGFAARRAEAALSRGTLRGLGIACFLETSRGAPNEWSAVRFAPDGRVDLAIGTQSNGQGHETSFPQVAADLLGLPIETFRLVQADTDRVRSGAGHGGARSMHLGGGALVKAIEAVLARARTVAAHLLQADPAEVEFASGRFTLRGATERGIDLLALARAASDPANLPEGMAPGGIDAEAMNISDIVTFPNGCHLAEVEIDPETGAVTLARYLAVDDFGRLINPMITIGQVQGGVAQGIGQALLENVAYDADSGQILSGSFMDYALPRAEDLPPLEITLEEDAPTASNPLGVKGSGQAGAIAAPQTIMAAVLDALAPLGVTQIDMPATPERIWRAIRDARGG